MPRAAPIISMRKPSCWTASSTAPRREGIPAQPRNPSIIFARIASETPRRVVERPRSSGARDILGVDGGDPIPHGIVLKRTRGLAVEGDERRRPETACIASNAPAARSTASRARVSSSAGTCRSPGNVVGDQTDRPGDRRRPSRHRTTKARPSGDSTAVPGDRSTREDSNSVQSGGAVYALRHDVLDMQRRRFPANLRRREPRFRCRRSFASATRSSSLSATTSRAARSDSLVPGNMASASRST